MFLAPSVMKTMPQKFMTSYQEQSLIEVLSADVLLANAQLQKQFKQIEQTVAIPKEYYQETYAGLIARFADYVQVMPSVTGGPLGSLLEEGLRRALLAIQLQLETAKEEEPIFTFAIFSAALLIDLRRLFLNRKIMISDQQGVFVSEWMPFEGSLPELSATHYKIRHFHRSLGQLSPYLTILLAKQVMPEAALLWLAEDFRLLNMWLAALCGDEEGAGSVGHFLNLAKIKMRQLEQKPKWSIPVEMTQPHETELGEAFWAWLKKNVIEEEMYQPDTGIYLVEEGIFLDVPKIFQDFCNKNKISNPDLVRKQFLQLGIAAENPENPEQLFIYLNKEESLPQKAQKKAEAKQAGRSFFKTTTDMQVIANKEQYEQVQASYRKQGLLIAEREWFFRASKKLEINKQLKEFVTAQKLKRRFAALARFIARKAGVLRRQMQTRFK